MFQYATFHPAITSEIVILSNADQVFDGTISAAKSLPNTTVFVLSTHGYNASRVPTSVREQYRVMVGDDANGTTANRCEASQDMKAQLLGNKKRFSNSWDAYIFHRALLANTLPENDKGKSQFTRLNFRREPTPYYMNELAAEYAALYDITRQLIGKVTVWNACKIIRSWHFHLTAKMHHVDETNGQWSRDIDGSGSSTQTTPDKARWNFVPPPYVYAPICSGSVSCFREDRHWRIS
jgi:hypothetical protein